MILLYLWIVSLCVRLKVAWSFQGVKGLGVFFSFTLFGTSACVWAEDFCMIWTFVFPSRAFTLTESPKLPLTLRARCFGLPTIRSFQDVSGGSFSCFYLNPLLEHCELPMMLYDLLRASIIFVLLLAPWARVGLKFFFRRDLIRLWGGSWVAGPELQLLCVS